MDEFRSSLADLSLPEIMGRLSIGDELLWTPERLVPFHHWVGHIPFAFWLVKVLRPRRLVELGTHRGNSYCAFCQAIAALRVSCHAFAVDTWQGDLHMGAQEGLLDDLRKHHDPRYDSFSTLLKMTFDEARSHVEDETVDLLHIDGTHTYDSVRQDFELWRDALSSRGVVLFHDIEVHQENYGVWRLWNELAQQHPSFGFVHSYGLGVLGVGSDLPQPLAELFALRSDSAVRVRALFEVRGQGLVARLNAEQLESEAAPVRGDLHAVQQSLQQRDQELHDTRERLHGALQAAEAEKQAQLGQLAVAAAEIERLMTVAQASEAEKQAQLGQLAVTAAEIERLMIDSQTAEVARRRTATDRDALIRNLRFELDRLAHDAESSAESSREAREQLDSLLSSTMWKATWPARRVLAKLPPGMRRAGGKTAQVLWWTFTLRLRSKLRENRALSILPPVVPEVCPVETRAAPAMPDLFEAVQRSPSGRIAVVVHIHYIELWRELRDALRSIPEGFDLYVSVTDEVMDRVAPEIRRDFPHSTVIAFPNHGRDLLPFLTFAQSGVLNRYELVCKLHTKRTDHRKDGDTWRSTLIDGILRDQRQVQRIISAFESDPDLGIVVADGQIFGTRPEHWVDNRARVQEIGSRIGIEHIPEAASFPGGSMYWIRPFLLRTVAGLDLRPSDFECEPLTRDGTTAHALERLVGLICADAGMSIREISELPLISPPPSVEPVRVIAYYLPQYHPTPENDAWWGAGFTEWTNVTRARPLFRDHRQPRLPADLGFYDLRMPETRAAQADLARRYGLSGFCYYYYWFNGRGMLRRPLDDMVTSGEPDFPFMICWANEPWSRNWDGGNREILIAQDYEPGWELAFAKDVAALMADRRYIRLNGRPMLSIYRVMHIPNRLAAFANLRSELRRLGIGEIHLSGGWVGFIGDEEVTEIPADNGLDSWFEFPPHRLPAGEITANLKDLDPAFTGRVYSYHQAVDHALASWAPPAGLRHRAVMAGWDNTARRPLAGHVFHGATPAVLRRWLRSMMRSEVSQGEGERVVFVNAWNEWAEGTYLEPDRDFGHGWLEAIASAVGITKSCQTENRLAGDIAADAADPAPASN